jgi:diketogulonate reductase-like aldo/keto reductase
MALTGYRLKDGTLMPRLGLGTWRMGEHDGSRADEVAALRLGLDLGMSLIDTAEMYGSGGAERVVGEAIRGRRDEVFLVSKFYPHHASRAKFRRACEGSLERLGVDCLDLYLLHWRGDVPLAETVETLGRLASEGKIRRWGVSNLDVADMEELLESDAGAEVAANQVLYNLSRRGVEYDLLPWCAQRQIAVMAYSPLEQGDLVDQARLRQLARGLAVQPAQLALAWTLRIPHVVSIPKATRLEHVRANRAAADLALDAAILGELDRAFPPPKRKLPLAMA